ncbi:hypothetical protein AB1K84_01190 [Mesobacillus foraminis]|uniref:hypothetical protein n=1 Tax=Mesobacillus foraminis TaxID=279826 RepID=UPI000EF45D3D|nr:hypothetical protein [Mesobacillus foraminis]MBT2756341.1 hypothetical protein [Mesobacillus foraminis]
MLSSKWGGRGHHKNKKHDDKDKKFVKKAGEGMSYNQTTVQKSKAEDTTGILAIQLVANNIAVPFNINIANTATGGSINKESGKGDLIDRDEAEFDLL